MARSKKRTDKVEKVRPYVEGVAKNLVHQLYGAQGPAWGTKLAELEDVAVELREILSEKLLDEALARQAAGDRPAVYQRCPGCQGPLVPDPDGAEPRIVATRGGEAEWSEPHERCPSCRKAFFPSVEELGD